MKIKWILFFLSLILGGCISSHTPNGSPGNLPTGYQSKIISVELIDKESSIYEYENIDIKIEVLDEYEIQFEPDYSLDVYQLLDGQWTKIERVKTQYLSGPITLHKADGDLSKMGYTTLIPILQGDAEKAQIRLFVFGAVVDKGMISDDLVGDFLDVIIWK